MELVIDPDVKAVAEFMQSTLAAARLVPVAKAVSELAPLLWGKYSPESVDALFLAHPQPSLSESATSPQVATESGCQEKDADVRPVVAMDANELMSR